LLLTLWKNLIATATPQLGRKADMKIERTATAECEFGAASATLGITVPESGGVVDVLLVDAFMERVDKALNRSVIPNLITNARKILVVKPDARNRETHVSESISADFMSYGIDLELAVNLNVEIEDMLVRALLITDIAPLSIALAIQKISSMVHDQAAEGYNDLIRKATPEQRRELQKVIEQDHVPLPDELDFFTRVFGGGLGHIHVIRL
jgi:hypothetical protein